MTATASRPDQDAGLFVAVPDQRRRPPLDPAGPGVAGWSPARQRLVLALAAMAVATVGVWAVMSFSIAFAPFFFDEMWRADFVRSDDPFGRMRTHDTPVAIGYLVTMRLLTGALPAEPFAFRFWSLVFVIAFVGVASAICHRVASAPVLGRPVLPGWPERPIPPGVAALAPALLVFVPAVQWYRYLNNYPFEMLYGAVLVFAALSLPRGGEVRRWPLPTLCVLLALSPLFTIGGLFLVPGVAACAATWAWRQRGGAGRLAAVVAAAVVSATLGAVAYVQLYRPVVQGARITEDWVEYRASLGGEDSVWDLLARTGTQARDGLLGLRLAGAGGVVLALATVALVASAAVGTVAVVRRSPWLVAIPLSAWAFAVGASAAMGWPMTLERVNLAFTSLVMVVVALGFVRIVCWPFESPWAALAVLAATVWVIWPQPIDPAAGAFSRTLPSDLAVVRDSPAPRNLVLAYHPLSHFYVHDALVNDAPAGRFTVVRDRSTSGDTSLYDSLDAVLRREGAQPGDLVWCVLPFELGDRFDAACRFDQAPVVPVVDQRRAGSVVRAYRLGALGP